MMVVRECLRKNSQSFYYLEKYDEKNKLISKRIINCYYDTARIQGEEITAIVTSQMDVLLSPYNYAKQNQSVNTIKRIISHIGKFYTFLSIFNLPISTVLNSSELSMMFHSFLLKENRTFRTNSDNVGNFRLEDDIRFEFMKTISGDTAKQEFKVICNYLEFLGYKNTYFQKYNPKKKYSTSLTKVETKQLVISSNKRKTLMECKRMLEWARKTNFTFYVGLQIIFSTAMRIGTLLSLTNEDVYSVNDNGVERYFIRARNRASNNADQQIKNIRTRTSSNQIGFVKEEKDSNYFEFEITKGVFDNILLLAKQHKKNSTKSEYKKSNYENNATADRLFYNSHLLIPSEENKYLFLNGLCGRMTQKNWNKTFMRPMFICLGISLDSETKSDGLNHILRHTIASYLAEKYNLTKEQIAGNILHDKSLEMADIYTHTLELEKVKNQMIQVNQFLAMVENATEENDTTNEIARMEEQMYEFFNDFNIE